jgi:hypothetical protein
MNQSSFLIQTVDCQLQPLDYPLAILSAVSNNDLHYSSLDWYLQLLFCTDPESYLFTLSSYMYNHCYVKVRMFCKYWYHC